LNAFDIPKDSPLRRTHSFFWGIRTNDEGTATPDSYYTLAVKGDIKVVAPAHVVGFAMDGESVLLDTGKPLKADAVILATGYQSSWTKIISGAVLIHIFSVFCLNNVCSEKTADEIGINKHPPFSKATNNWDYPSLRGGPEIHPENARWVTSIYRGIVPAKNILRRDFAVAGTLVRLT
jgi:dimethylaniline monooxygenase (N-oxide forming)